MSPLILHHYALSPYSQKIRSMLGYSGLAWQSALTKEMPPRPILATLAGGYRRIPVAQRGADVFCDSRIIASEIAAESGRIELAPENMSEDEQRWVEVAEGKLFFACVMAAGSPELRRKARQTLGFRDGIRLVTDRWSMGRRAAVPVPGFRSSGKLVREQLGRVEAALERDFLFGDAPRLGDFATYHGLWFVRDLGEKPYVARYPKTVAWMDRIRSFGEGERREIGAEEAVAIARDAEPRPVADDDTRHAWVGKQVKVAPADYGQVPTIGLLAGSTPTRWILRREAPKVGALHVHFPKVGFLLTLA